MFPVHQVWPKPSCKAQWKGNKTRRTKEETGRHQGMDRSGVRQVLEGSGVQGKMEKTGCEIICGAPTTLAVKGLMMMMMIQKCQKKKKKKKCHYRVKTPIKIRNDMKVWLSLFFFFFLLFFTVHSLYLMCVHHMVMFLILISLAEYAINYGLETNVLPLCVSVPGMNIFLIF